MAKAEPAIRPGSFCCYLSDSYRSPAWKRFLASLKTTSRGKQDEVADELSWSQEKPQRFRMGVNPSNHMMPFIEVSFLGMVRQNLSQPVPSFLVQSHYANSPASGIQS